VVTGHTDQGNSGISGSHFIAFPLCQLPETTTSGLHEIVLHIWAFDYNSCQAVIQRMISSGSFDVLAEFMPGVKVLIQVAAQLGAYVERPR
jgi:hypothetical protein